MSNIFTKSKDHNPNYLATICKIGPLSPIEGADRLKTAVVNGHTIVVSAEQKPTDTVVYFPCESAVADKYLSANNLYEIGRADRNANFREVEDLIKKAEKAVEANDLEKANELKDKAKALCGYFGSTRRVRILKLRGVYSDGFIADVETLRKAYPDELDWRVKFDEYLDVQFDTIGKELVCEKYVPKVNEQVPHGQGNWHKRMKTLKRFDRVNTEYFKFHYDTKMLVEHIKEISPDDMVDVTVKVHGKSAVVANVLCNRKLTLLDKIKRFFGKDVPTLEYGNIYSSKRVIRNQYVNPKASEFEDTSEWADVNRVFAPYVSKGMTVYGEIVGYKEGTGEFMQPNHDYGCKKGQWKFMPYRITTQDGVDGKPFEWNIHDVDQWTRKLVHNHPELEEHVMYLTIVYQGLLKDMYPDLPVDEHFHEELLKRLKADKDRLGMELDEPLCKNKVPREGVVFRITDDKVSFPRAWKLKTMRHNELDKKQKDKGVVDGEDIS